MAALYMDSSFTGNDSILEEGIVKETDIKTDVYESLQKTKDCELYQALEKGKSNQEVDTNRCKVITQKNIIYMFGFLLSIAVIGTLIYVVIKLASTAETDIDECSSVMCGNGTCIDGIGNYRCSCNLGFDGNNCENDIDECSTVTCGNGTCIDGIGNYSCSCNVGYDGTNCENDIDECNSVTCGNGTCIDDIGNYSCSCNVGFDGTNCEHGYRLVTDDMNWVQAKVNCESLGGRLADIKSQKEQTFIENILPLAVNLYWIGGRDNSKTFVWLDGTGLSEGYNHWYPGQPDAGEGNVEYCVMLYQRQYGTTYTWDDAPCQRKNFMIQSLCEFN